MGKIQFVRADDVSFVNAGEIARVAKLSPNSGTSGDAPGSAHEAALDDADYQQELDGSDVKVYLTGGPHTPQLFEVRISPNVRVREHAHAEDEVIIVQEGELRFRQRTYGPGSVIAIPQFTLYAFSAGPEGLRFLNFRAKPTGGLTQGVLSKKELVAYRRTLTSRRDDELVDAGSN